MNELTYGQLPVSPEHGVAIHCSEGCFGCEAPMVLLREITSWVDVRSSSVTA